MTGFAIPSCSTNSAARSTRSSSPSANTMRAAFDFAVANTGRITIPVR